MYLKFRLQVAFFLFPYHTPRLIQYTVRRILRPQINYFWGGIAFPVEIQRTFLDFPDRVPRKIFKEKELNVKNVIRLLQPIWSVVPFCSWLIENGNKLQRYGKLVID